MPPARLPRPVRRRKPLTRRPGDRRGAVLALVAIMMVVLLGFTAIAVDGSYLFVTKAQLQTVADATAHAAAVEISKDRKADAAAVALAFSAQNKADGKTNTVVAGRITPGHWDDRNTPAFAPRGSWADADVNAAQAVARTDVGLYFARIFGPTSSEVGATGVAAVGSLSSTGCAKPWALAYQTLLWAAGRTNTADLSPLTAAEVDRLTDGTREIMFKVGPGEQAVDVATNTKIPGNFHAVNFPVYRYANGMLNPNYREEPGGGATAYRNWIGSPVCGRPIRVGDWLMTKPGVMPGPTEQGMDDLCGGGGGKGGVCNPAQEVVLPIWQNPPEKAGSTEVQVKYVGAFSVTRWDNDANVYGRFITMSAKEGGGFVPVPGPVTKVALVQ